MLTFTTTEPHCMLAAADIDVLVPQREHKVLNSEWVHMGLYLHGNVQGEAGFDLPLLVEGELDLLKEHDGTACEVELPPKKKRLWSWFMPTPNRRIKCLMFTWDTRRMGTKMVSGNPVRMYEGLIVAADDDEAVAYARRMKAERAPTL